MVTRLMLLAAALLFTSGCATYQTRYVYDDGYYADGVAYEDRNGSRYAPAHDGYGDYYVGQREYRYVDSYYYPNYLQWPAYHSLFWGFNRWYHDPFHYPGYYYGVTYFPSNFLSFTSRRGLFMFDVGHRYFPYSPYRYSVYDNYFDWSYWHHHYPSHRQNHRGPRYGSARNEAERLAWRARTVDNRSLNQAASDSMRQTDRGRADYGSRAQVRDDARLRAAGNRTRPSVQGSESYPGPESYPQRRASATSRGAARANAVPVDRSRAVSQREQTRKPGADMSKPLQRVAPDRRDYRAAPVASRANPSEAAAPRVIERRSAPQVRQVQVRRAYAGSESYERSTAAPRATRPQQYQRARTIEPAAAPSAYQRQTRAVSGYPQPRDRAAPQHYPQPQSRDQQQTRSYAAPQPAPQYREPARSQRSASSERSESRKTDRKTRDDR